MPALIWMRHPRFPLVAIGEGTWQNDVSGLMLLQGVALAYQFGYGGNDFLWGVAPENIVFGGAGDDILSTAIGTGTLYGDEGRDELVGFNSADCLYGGLDTDTLRGKGGNDCIFGGAEYDVIRGEANNDSLYGEAGNDFIWAGDGNDQAFGGSGIDAIAGEAGSDTIYGGELGDVISGGPDNDSLHASSRLSMGGEWVYDYRSVAADLVRGDAGMDGIVGGGGGMTAYGGDGNDAISVIGADTVYGGTGEDTFYFGVMSAIQRDNRGTIFAYGEEGRDNFFVNNTKAPLIEIYGGAEDDYFVIGSAQRNHFVGGAGGDAFAITVSNRHGQRFYYERASDSPFRDPDEISFSNGASGRIEIYLSRAHFVSTLPDISEGPWNTQALTFRDRNNTEMWIITPAASSVSAYLY